MLTKPHLVGQVAQQLGQHALLIEEEKQPKKNSESIFDEEEEDKHDDASLDYVIWE